MCRSDCVLNRKSFFIDYALKHLSSSNYLNHGLKPVKMCKKLDRLLKTSSLFIKFVRLNVIESMTFAVKTNHILLS